MSIARKSSPEPIHASILSEILSDPALQEQNTSAWSELRAISKESNSDIFNQSLLVFGNRQEDAGNEALAARVYRALQTGAPQGSEVAQRAHSRLSALTGQGGSFGDQFEVSLRHFREQAPVAVGTMLPGFLAFKTVQLGMWNGLLNRATSSFLTRGVGAEAFASLLALVAEGPVMTASQHALGQEGVSWRSDLLANYRMMLGLRAAGGAVSLLGRVPGAPQGIWRSVAHQVGTLGGLTLAQGGDLTWSQTFQTLGYFHLTASLTGGFWGGSLAAREAALRQASARPTPASPASRQSSALLEEGAAAGGSRISMRRSDLPEHIFKIGPDKPPPGNKPLFGLSAGLAQTRPYVGGKYVPGSKTTTEVASAHEGFIRSGKVTVGGQQVSAQEIRNLDPKGFQAEVWKGTSSIQLESTNVSLEMESFGSFTKSVSLKLARPDGRYRTGSGGKISAMDFADYIGAMSIVLGRALTLHDIPPEVKNRFQNLPEDLDPFDLLFLRHEIAGPNARNYKHGSEGWAEVVKLFKGDATAAKETVPLFVNNMALRGWDNVGDLIANQKTILELTLPDFKGIVADRGGPPLRSEHLVEVIERVAEKRNIKILDALKEGKIIGWLSDAPIFGGKQGNFIWYIPGFDPKEVFDVLRVRGNERGEGGWEEKYPQFTMTRYRGLHGSLEVYEHEMIIPPIGLYHWFSLHHDVPDEFQIHFRSAKAGEIAQLGLTTEVRPNLHKIENITGAYTFAKPKGSRVKETIGIYSLFIKGSLEGQTSLKDALSAEETRLYGSIKRAGGITNTILSMMQNPEAGLKPGEMDGYKAKGGGLKVPLPTGIKYSMDPHVVER